VNACETGATGAVVLPTIQSILSSLPLRKQKFSLLATTSSVKEAEQDPIRTLTI